MVHRHYVHRLVSLGYTASSHLLVLTSLTSQPQPSASGLDVDALLRQSPISLLCLVLSVTPKLQPFPSSIFRNMAKPQIVLLPGAWHTPSCMAALISKLESLGYGVHTSRLPSVGNPNPPQDLSEDIAVVRSLVEQAIDKDNDVVVFPHSWAGIVTGSALVGLGKKEREAEGKKGGVVRTGYMASFILPKGVSLMDAAGGEIAWWCELKVRMLICRASD
jgi:hypothetical protein